MAFFDKMKAAAKTAGNYALSQAEELQNYMIIMCWQVLLDFPVR